MKNEIDQVDRTDENSDAPVIVVTLADGWTERFWLTGLSDDEYIKRTKILRDHFKFQPKCRRYGCKDYVYEDGLCNFHFSQ